MTRLVCTHVQTNEVHFLSNKIHYLNYTPTAIMLARYVTHMNTQSPGGICYASLEVCQNTNPPPLRRNHTALVRTFLETVTFILRQDKLNVTGR